MKNLTVHLDDKPIYDIVYEESFDALPSMMKELGYSNRKICVVSESHVASLYLDAILLSIKDSKDERSLMQRSAVCLSGSGNDIRRISSLLRLAIAPLPPCREFHIYLRYLLVWNSHFVIAVLDR